MSRESKVAAFTDTGALRDLIAQLHTSTQISEGTPTENVFQLVRRPGFASALMRARATRSDRRRITWWVCLTGSACAMR